MAAKTPVKLYLRCNFFIIIILFYTTGSEKVQVKIQKLHRKKKALSIKAEKLNCVYVYQYQWSHLSDHSPTCSYKKTRLRPSMMQNKHTLLSLMSVHTDILSTFGLQSPTS